MLTKATSILGMALLIPLSGTTQANEGNLVINDIFSVRTDTQPSGSGHTILDNCGASSGVQSATLKVWQHGNSSTVDIKVQDARPDTVYTVWLRTAGSGLDGASIGGSPLTNGGATPLAPGYALDEMISYTPPFGGTSSPTNGFVTDAKGDANFSIRLDFPLVGGAYPFQKASEAALAAWQAAGGNPNAQRIPSPVVNPADPNINAPFLLRVISHCTDQQGHGLSPAVREAWFQYP